MELRPLWSGDYRNERYSGPASLAIHALVIAALLLLGGKRVITGHPPDHTPIFLPSDISLYVPSFPQAKPGDLGGGGGGNRSPDPASKGVLPRFSTEQYTPPSAVQLNDAPILPMEATLLSPVEMKRLLDSGALGSPTGVAGPPSNGPGSGGGIGNGRNGGVGDNVGPGAGNGPGGFKGVMTTGNGVTKPEVIYRVEPEFTDAARKAKHQGTVTVSIVVDASGHVAEAHVVNSLGLGLDEKALEAVKQWRFRPGTKDGKAVAVYAAIAVTFRLL